MSGGEGARSQGCTRFIRGHWKVQGCNSIHLTGRRIFSMFLGVSERTSMLGLDYHQNIYVTSLRFSAPRWCF